MSKVVYLGIFMQALFVLVSANCGGNLTDANGQFTSPNYPDNYEFGLECKWTITVAADSKVSLTFLNNSVDILSTGGESGCGDNQVSVKDPDSILETKLFCAQSQPTGDITSDRNRLIVIFKSPKNEIKNSTGFSASYATLAPPTVPVTAPVTNATVPVTNATITTTPPTPVTSSAPVTQSPPKKKLSKGAVAAICIVVILVVLLVIDIILYQKDMGVIYTCRRACCGGYGAVST